MDHMVFGERCGVQEQPGMTQGNNYTQTKGCCSSLSCLQHGSWEETKGKGKCIQFNIIQAYTYFQLRSFQNPTWFPKAIK